MSTNIPRQLKMLGMLLFLLGLITGFIIMQFKNPRMGLSAHLEGVMNGTFLVVAGFVWNELSLSDGQRKITLYTLLYGTFANWLFTLLSAVLGTSRTTPIAGSGFNGGELQETLVTAGLASVGLTMVVALALMVYGLRGKLAS